MPTTQVCSVEGCDEFALFRTRTKPAWCEQHLGDIYDRAGLSLIEPFTKPKDYLLTRCTSCGFEGHYRLEYVLQTLDRREKTCRACFWREWAREQRALLGNDTARESVEHAEAVAAENGYTYLGPLTEPCLEDDPHKVKCKRCGVITAERVGDIAWGCNCRKSNKTASAGTSKAVGANLVKNATEEFVSWWDHEKNPEQLWRTAKKGSRKTAWWTCPNGHTFERRIDEMFKSGFCRQCFEGEWREKQAHDAIEALAWRLAHALSSVADVPELATAWAEADIDPAGVAALSEEKFTFTCDRGHPFRARPEEASRYECRKCFGVKTRERNIAAAKSGEVKSRLTPEITSQWHPTKNEGLLLGAIPPTSTRNVWWLDPVCGHEWQDIVGNRDKYERYRCPFCETILDSLAYHYPDVAALWSDENELSPWQVRPHTNQIAPPPLWVCPKHPEHTWRAMPSRLVNGSGCPECKTVGKSAVERLYAKAAKKVWGNASSGQRVYSDNFTNHSSWSVDVLVDLPGGKQLGIEYDGSYWHKDKTETDLVKSFDLLRHGLILCRIREHPLPGLDINDESYFELVAYAGSNDPEQELAEFAEVLAQHLEST